MFTRTTRFVAALLPFILAGCSKPADAPVQESGSASAAEAVTTASACTLPAALRGKKWEVFSTVEDKEEYFDLPQLNDALTVTCEEVSGRPHFFLHFDGAAGQKHFEDISGVSLQYFDKNKQLESQGVEKFTTPDQFVAYLKEVTRADYDYLVGSGVVRKGDANATPTSVVAVAVPWTLIDSQGNRRDTLTIILVNLDEAPLPLSGTAVASQPIGPSVKQGGVIHGKS